MNWKRYKKAFGAALVAALSALAAALADEPAMAGGIVATALPTLLAVFGLRND